MISFDLRRGIAITSELSRPLALRLRVFLLIDGVKQETANSLSVDLLRRLAIQPGELLAEEVPPGLVVACQAGVVLEVRRDRRGENFAAKNVILVEEEDLSDRQPSAKRLLALSTQATYDGGSDKPLGVAYLREKHA